MMILHDMREIRGIVERSQSEGLSEEDFLRLRRLVQDGEPQRFHEILQTREQVLRHARRLILLHDLKREQLRLTGQA